MRRYILSRANVVASEATRSDKAPSRCVSIRTPFEPIEGGSVLDGIRPGLRRCHLNLGLPWKVVAIHPLFAVALGLSVRRSAYSLVASLGSPVGLIGTRGADHP